MAKAALVAHYARMKSAPTGYRTVRADGSIWEKKADHERGSPWRQLADGTSHRRLAHDSSSAVHEYVSTQGPQTAWGSVRDRLQLDGHTPSPDIHPVHVDIDHEGDTDSKPVLSWTDAHGNKRNSYTKRFHFDRAASHHQNAADVHQRLTSAHANLLKKGDPTSLAAALVIQTGYSPDEVANLRDGQHELNGEKSVFTVPHARGGVKHMHVRAPLVTAHVIAQQAGTGASFFGASAKRIRSAVHRAAGGVITDEELRYHAAARIAADHLSKTKPCNFSEHGYAAGMALAHANVMEASARVAEHFGHDAAPAGMCFVPPVVVTAYLHECGADAYHGGLNAGSSAKKQEVGADEPGADAEADVEKGRGVRSAADEALWDEAKAIVEHEHGSAKNKYALVTYIFQKMKASRQRKARKSQCSSRSVEQTSSTEPTGISSPSQRAVQSSERRTRERRSRTLTHTQQPLSTTYAPTEQARCLDRNEWVGLAKSDDFKTEAGKRTWPFVMRGQVVDLVIEVDGDEATLTAGEHVSTRSVSAVQEMLVKQYTSDRVAKSFGWVTPYEDVKVDQAKAEERKIFDAVVGPKTQAADGGYDLRQKMASIYQAALEKARSRGDTTKIAEAGLYLAAGDYAGAIVLIEKSMSDGAVSGGHRGPEGEPVGTVHARADGRDYRKTEEGWRKLPKGRKDKKEKKADSPTLEGARKRLTRLRGEYRASTNPDVRQRLRKEIIALSERVHRMRAQEDERAAAKRGTAQKSAAVDPLEQWVERAHRSRHAQLEAVVTKARYTSVGEGMLQLSTGAAAVLAKQYVDEFGSAALVDLITNNIG